MRAFIVRIVVFLLLPCLSVDAPSGVRPLTWHHRLGNCTFGGAFDEQTLALPAAGGTNCLGKPRMDLVHGVENLLLLRRYTGAGETSIHKALQQAERWIQEGKFLEAILLLNELLDDLTHAQKTNEIAPLMDKWNVRYPSHLSVDLIDEADLEQFIRYIEALPNSIAGPSESVEFEERLRTAFRSDLTRALEQSGYDSLDEMLTDRVDAEKVETVFQVDVTEPFRERLGGTTSITLPVKGWPTVSRIVEQLQIQHPVLRDIQWELKVVPNVESVGDTVLPGHQLSLVAPSSSSTERSNPGPSDPLLKCAAAVVSTVLWKISPAVSLVAGIAAMWFAATAFFSRLNAMAEKTPDRDRAA
jgi:hypothetical protein